MGIRRGFIRSDDEDEGDGVNGDGAVPSSVAGKIKRRSKHNNPKKDLVISQAAYGMCSTSGKAKKFKRLKKAVELETEEGLLNSDSDEEDYELEDFSGSALRQEKLGKRDGRWAAGPSQSFRKRKHRFVSVRNAYRSKAAVGVQYKETAEESEQKQTCNDPQIPLGKEFEQYLLEDMRMAAKDNHIKETDVPERFQIHEQPVSPTSPKGNWTTEANWIYDRVFGNFAAIPQWEELKSIAEIDKEEIVQEIIFVLRQLHHKNREIPFIGMYRYHGCIHLACKHGNNHASSPYEENNGLLNPYKALWLVFYWDRKWLSLQHRKHLQQEAYKKRVELQDCEDVAKKVLLDALMQALQEAESEQDVDDLDAKFNLQFPADEVTLLKGQYKRPKRQSYYSLCRKSGLTQLAKQLSITPEQLGENLQATQKIHEPLDCAVAPEDISLSCTSGQFAEVHHALAGARHIAAYELSCEPSIRKYVRSLFSEHAVVNTKPTEKGNIAINAFHEFACVKCVQEKPVQKFDDGEWLLIQRAEEEELLEVTIELTQEILDGIVLQGLQANYLSSGSSTMAELWNEHRKQTLREALVKMILPLLVKETRMSLMAKAKAWIQSECSNNLWKRVSVAPYPTPDASSGDKASVDAAAARVLACCWGSRNPPTTFVMLNPFGDITDTLQTGYLNLYSGSSEQQLQRKSDDQQRLQKFILEHQPHVVIVGATVNHACRYLKDTIAETVARAAEENSELSAVAVIYGEESMPLLYEKSQVSMAQLPKLPSIMRRAVALGRNLQNPLALIASLCNPSKDIVALNLHSMQRFLNAEEVYSAIEQVMITVTNQVGVDVNLAAAHEWLISPLQFVSGLGPRKASMLQQFIQGLRSLPSRENLLRHPISLKEVIYTNCCGFLRIRRVANAISGSRKIDPLDDTRIHRVANAISGSRKIDPLDDTRIHPKSYELARKLAIYALSIDQAFMEGETDVDQIEMAIEHIRQNPDALTESVVMDFFNSTQETRQVKIETLKDIQAELLCGFRDYRASYVQPTQDEEFTWLTGEDDTSLASGKAVNATVQRVFRHRIICVLESGIRGVLEKEDFTTEAGVDLTKVVSEGSSLTCCIAGVLKDQFLVQLTCTKNNIEPESSQDAFGSSVQNVLSSDVTIQTLGEKNVRENNFRPRRILHPLFQNISTADAIKALSGKNPGEVVFHPSSGGPTCLSMTLKFHDDVYVHKEIVELEKDSTDLASFSKLGKILKIGGRTFPNLNEVVTCYVSPLMSRLKEVLESKEFRSGSDSEIRSFLHQEKELCSKSLVYCFSMCRASPGAITVSYLMDMNIKHEKIDLYPEGYGFQSKMFRKIDTLSNYLKTTALAPVNGEGQEWGGQREGGCEHKGDGSGRGRGGRYGSGRRGRGREGRGGRGNRSSGKWGSNDKGEDGDYNFRDAQEGAEKETNTGDAFSGGWGSDTDWTQNRTDNGGDNWGCSPRGSFRGSRGLGRGNGRRGGRAQWAQTNDNNGDDNFWDGGKGKSEEMANIDSGKASDTDARDDWWRSKGSLKDQHSDQNEKEMNNSWGASNNRKDSTEKVWNGWSGGSGSYALHEPMDDGWGNSGGSSKVQEKHSHGNASGRTGWEMDGGGKTPTEDVNGSKSGGWADWEVSGTGSKALHEPPAKDEGWGDAGGSIKVEEKHSHGDDASGWEMAGGGKKPEEDCTGTKWGGWADWGVSGRGSKALHERPAKDEGWENAGGSIKVQEKHSHGNDASGWTGWETTGSGKTHAEDVISSKLGGWTDWGASGDGTKPDKCPLGSKSDGLEGWGSAVECKKGFNTVSSKENGEAKGGPKANTGWDRNAFKSTNIKAPTENQWGEWGNSNVGGSGEGLSRADDWKKNTGGPTTNGAGWDASEKRESQTESGWGGEDLWTQKQKGEGLSRADVWKKNTGGPTTNGAGWDASEKRESQTESGWGGEDLWTQKQKGDRHDSRSGTGWDTFKCQTDSGWGGGGDGLLGKWPADDRPPTRAQKEGEDDNSYCPERGTFRGGRGWRRGMGRGDNDGWTRNNGDGTDDMERGGRGHWPQSEGDTGIRGRGCWSQSEGDAGRGGRGRWSQGGVRGRGGRGRWSQREGDMGRGGRGRWSQSQGDGAGRMGRGGRGPWSQDRGDGAGDMGRGGRGRRPLNRGDGLSDNAWCSGSEISRGNNGWNKDIAVENSGRASAADANDWWALGGSQATGEKENQQQNGWCAISHSKDVAEKEWNGWTQGCGSQAASALETGMDTWGKPTEPNNELSKETLTKNPNGGIRSGWDTVASDDSTHKQLNEFMDNGSSRVSVSLEEGSGWGANDSGWGDGGHHQQLEGGGHGNVCHSQSKTFSDNRGWGRGRGRCGVWPETQADSGSDKAWCRNSMRSSGWSIEEKSGCDFKSNADAWKPADTVSNPPSLKQDGWCPKNDSGGLLERQWNEWEDSGIANGMGKGQVLDKGGEAAGEVAKGCKEISSGSEPSGWAEFGTKQISCMELESSCKVASKEITEDKGDGIWGACEDHKNHTDCDEMAGFSSQRGPIYNAVEPGDTSDALKNQNIREDAVLSGFSGVVQGNRSDDSVVGMIESTPSCKDMGGMIESAPSCKGMGQEGIINHVTTADCADCGVRGPNEDAGDSISLV